MIASNLKSKIVQKFLGETHYLGVGCSKLKAAYLVNYFPGFLGKILRIAHPVNYSYLPPCFPMDFNGIKCDLGEMMDTCTAYITTDINGYLIWVH